MEPDYCHACCGCSSSSASNCHDQEAMSDPMINNIVDLDKDGDDGQGTADGSEAIGSGDVAVTPAGEQCKDAVAATASHGKRSTPSNPRVTYKAWLHFDRLEVDGKPFAKCKYCARVYTANTTKNGTSTILGHSRTCVKNPENKNKVDNKQPGLPFERVDKGKESTASYQFDQSQSRVDLAEMLIVDELPFSTVEGKGFKKFVSGLRPEFKIPSRQTAVRDIFTIYESEKQQLHDYFRTHNPRVCLTTDTWTSNQQINYMCLTAHYVDEQWVLRKKILNFCPILGHSGAEIAQGIEACLLSWGIKTVMTITVDNASSNDTALTYLSRKLNLSGSTVLGGKFMHMRCLAHIINLIVQDGISMMGVAVERVRVAVRYIKVSPARLKVFKSCIKAAGIESKKLLCLDVVTRWNSTYLMLKAACRLEKAFEKFETKDRGLRLDMEERKRKDGSKLGMLTFLDWAEVKSFMDFLEMFYDMTVRVSGSSYVTSHTILDDICDISHMIREGQVSDNVDMQNMANKMRVKYDKYFGSIEKMNLYIFLAPIFDPRNKLRYVNYSIGQIYNPNVSPHITAHVKSTLDELFAEYLGLYGSTKEPTALPATHSLVSAVGNPLKGHNQSSYKRLRFSQEGTLKSELEKYLNDAVEEDSTSFDLLQWWSLNGHRYPVIARMARDILAIPISTVSSESAFSGGGRILSNFRSSISPFLVQVLICTQDWLKDPKPLLETEEDLELLQSLEEELFEAAKPEGLPQDM